MFISLECLITVLEVPAIWLKNQCHAPLVFDILFNNNMPYITLEYNLAKQSIKLKKRTINY